MVRKMIRRFKILISVVALVCLSLNVWAEEKNMLFNKPKHVIFLIHGIGGDKTHFGHMSKALSRILNKKDPDTKYIIRSIEYNTGDNEKTSYEFAQDVDLIIKRTTASAKFKDKDKISFIMHSQGGLIGAIWVFRSLMLAPGFSDPETVEHLDAFITLGSPFWGAKTAQWGSEMKALATKLDIDIPLPYGKRELEQMSFGSDQIFDFRMAMIDQQYQHHIKYLKDNIRFLNIVGVADVLNPLGIFVSGTGKYEDDGAVPLSSARFNFLYNQNIDSVYEEGDVLTLENVKEIDMAPYVVVNAMHRSPLPELANFAGIAQIPKKCINREDCGHPTFPYIWNHILGNKIEQLDDSLGNFRTFLLDINLRVDAEKVYECEDINLEITKLDGSPLEKSNVEISKFYELYAEGRRSSQRYPNQCRYYYTGTLKKFLEGRRESILIKISALGLKTRYVEMRLKESYSSFVDVNIIASKNTGGTHHETQ